MQLAPALQAIVDALLAKSEDRRRVTLDELAEKIGVRAITPEEIDAIIEALEAAGRTVDGESGGKGRGTVSANLREVLIAARALTPELGRRPTHAEIAARAGLSLDDVRHALALAKVMQR